MLLAHPFGCLAGSALAVLLVGGAPAQAKAPLASLAQEETASKRSFTVGARKYVFTPKRIEVDQDDLVKIVVHSEDIAHSFTIDSYRIAKRVAGGGSTAFEFRADKPGTFIFYCNLTADDGCRQMRGELIVRPRR